MRYTEKRWVSLSLMGGVLIAAVFFLALLVYRLLSPRIVLVNESDLTYGQLVVILPSSRVSFAPVDALTTSTIYFSTQENGGQARYELVSGNGNDVVAKGDFPYRADHQLARVIRIRVSPEARVTVTLAE